MVARVIYGFAGVSEDFVDTSHASKRMSCAQVRNCNSTLTQNEKNLVIKIEEKFEVVITDFKSALSNWTTIGNTASYVKYSSGLMGFVSVVMWNLILEEVRLKVIGSIVIAFAAACFARGAHLVQKTANKEKKTFDNLGKNLEKRITDFRKEVKTKGLVSFQTKLVCLKESFRPHAIQCISDDEIRDLFKQHLEQIKNKPFKEWVHSNDDLFLSLFKGLPEHRLFSSQSQTFLAIKAYNDFRNVINEYKGKPSLRFDSQKKIIVESFHKNTETANGFSKLFIERFNEVAEYNVVDDQYYDLVGDEFSTYLEKIYDGPNQVKDLISTGTALENLNNIVKKVTEHQYRRVFINVFEKNGIGSVNYDQYIQWANRLFQSITDKDLRDFLTLFICDLINKSSSSDQSSEPKPNLQSSKKATKSKQNKHLEKKQPTKPEEEVTPPDTTLRIQTDESTDSGLKITNTASESQDLTAKIQSQETASQNDNAPSEEHFSGESKNEVSLSQMEDKGSLPKENNIEIMSPPPLFGNGLLSPLNKLIPDVKKPKPPLPPKRVNLKPSSSTTAEQRQDNIDKVE